MGGRGSSGGRSSGSSASKSSIQAELTQGNINYAMNKSYKYSDDAHDYKKQALVEKAMAKKFRQKGNLKKAEEYENFAKESKRKQQEAEKKAKQYRKEANKLSKTKEKSIPTSYKYEGDNGYSRTVYKSPQKALERWNQSRQNTVSTAYADAPTIVKAPSGGYSVVPHKLVKRNNLKEIAPSQIPKLEN